MTSDVSREELIELVTRHQVVEPEPLWHYLAERGGGGALPTGGADLAADMVEAGLLTSFQAERILADDGRSLSVGRYRILDRLGGSVYLAERRPGGLGKVAVKVLPLSEQADRAGVERFRREAEALARLDHPGVVTIKDVGEDDGRTFLVTEYVEGKTLTQLVAEQGPLPLVVAARLIYEAAVALAHVHEAGIVHRNLQPDHLMQDMKGTVRLLDLGLARFLDNPGDNLTVNLQPDAVLGTVEYLAPEQILNSHDADARADVYALGATFYFLLTGKAPFNLHAVLRLAAGVVTHPQPLAQLRCDLPREMLDVIEKMMATSASARYQTPATAAAAIHAWLHEVAPPPLVAPRHGSTRVPMLTRPNLGTVPAEAAEPAEGFSVRSIVGLTAGVMGLVFLVVLAAKLLVR